MPQCSPLTPPLTNIRPWHSSTESARWEASLAKVDSTLHRLITRPQVNKAVHTIVLRACGLRREQVVAIQANTVAQTTGTRKTHRERREGEKPPAELSGGADHAGEGIGANGDPLPWREEKRLGFRAICLRDWLLDAAG